MNERFNALLAASYLNVAIHKFGMAEEKRGIKTTPVQTANVKKYSMNVIPDEVESRYDIRYVYPHTADSIKEKVDNIINHIKEITGCAFSYEILQKGKATSTEELAPMLEKIAEESQISTEKMYSWAGHDSGYVPAEKKGFIFIPSTGESHNPNENTTREDIERGITLQTRLAKNLLREKNLENHKTNEKETEI
jgi:acetylornithine deacetylase/succinyl-diaminopimelate desuccinylase-like protein